MRASQQSAVSSEQFNATPEEITALAASLGCRYDGHWAAYNLWQFTDLLTKSSFTVRAYSPDTLSTRLREERDRTREVFECLSTVPELAGQPDPEELSL